MGLLEVLLGSGLIIIAGGWLVERGSHKKTHEILENQIASFKVDMEKMAVKQDIAENKQQNSEIFQATILTELKYIRIQLDKLAATK